MHEVRAPTKFLDLVTSSVSDTIKDAKRSMADEEDVVFQVVTFASDSMFISTCLCECCFVLLLSLSPLYFLLSLSTLSAGVLNFCHRT